MILTKEDVKNFYVVEDTETGVIVSDGLMYYDVKITNDDILDILIKKIGINPATDLLGLYESHKDNVVREHLKNNFWDFKVAVEDFYSDINIDSFEDFNTWCYNYCNYEFCMDIDERGLCRYHLEEDIDGLDSFTVYEDMSMSYFESQLHHFEELLYTLQKIRDNLTIKADDYREKLLNNLNDKLKDNNLKPILIKKYKNETEVVNTIKELNSDSPENLNKFLEDYNTKNNHILSNHGLVYIDLVKDTDGHYWTSTDYSNSDDDDYMYNDDIHVNIQDILTTDDILYQPNLKECKDIDDKFYYKNKRHDYDWER